MKWGPPESGVNWIRRMNNEKTKNASAATSGRSRLLPVPALVGRALRHV